MGGGGIPGGGGALDWDDPGGAGGGGTIEGGGGMAIWGIPVGYNKESLTVNAASGFRWGSSHFHLTWMHASRRERWWSWWKSTTTLRCTSAWRHGQRRGHCWGHCSRWGNWRENRWHACRKHTERRWCDFAYTLHRITKITLSLNIRLNI